VAEPVTTVFFQIMRGIYQVSRRVEQAVKIDADKFKSRIVAHLLVGLEAVIFTRNTA